LFASFPTHPQHLNFRLGQASGPWKTLTDYDPRTATSAPALPAGFAFQIAPEKQGKEDTTQIDLAHAPTDLQLRLFAVDSANHEHLRGLRQLKELQLKDTKVTDAGLKHVVGLIMLQSLNLEGTKITDAGLPDINGLNQLQTLNLGYTKVTDDGVRTLQAALPNCKITH